MEVNRCLNCMEEITDAVCPRCGFNHYQVYEQSPMALKANTVLYGRYLVGRMLGQGGFGMTYIGFDLLLNIKVAIKEYFPMGSVSRDNTISNLIQWNLSKDQEEQWKEGCESFLKEARKMAKLDSISGIVRVRDTFYENQTAYIIMDFIEGITLKKYLQSNGTMDYVSCINMLSPMMSSLSKVHGQGLIHRDISPDNMMVMGNGSLMLLDLGAAKDVSTGREGMSQLVTKRGFSPAEQYMESGSVGPWTDVYAFCATIYYCMYGKLIPEAMERLMEDPLTFPTLPNGTELPDDIKATLSDGMAVHTENRIQTMDELMARLTPYITAPSQDMLSAMQNYSATAKANKKKKKKKLAKILIPSFSVLLVAVAAVLLFLFRPWEPKIKQLGNTNTNMLNDGGMVIKEKEYEYFLDHNYNLHLCKYDENDSCFYVDASEIVAENAMYLNLGKDKVYFMQDAGTENVKLSSMDFDGSNVTVILENLNYPMFLQYALLSNGDEYLYYLNANDDETGYVLERYDIKANKTETVVNEDLCWYNISGKSIYYTAYNEKGSVSLKKAGLNGKRPKTLAKDKLYAYGFIENDSIFLYSFEKQAMCVLDMKGKEKTVLYDANMDTTNFTFAYGDGWIYYVNADDKGVYRIREDGTANGMLFDEVYIISIGYNSDELWLQEGYYDTNDELKLLRSYVCYKDGTSVIVLDEADLMTTEDGLVYRQDGNGITICGYEGDKDALFIPLNIDGVPVTNFDFGDLPDDMKLYLIDNEEDFEYETTGDGTGIIITKYTGSNDVPTFKIPDELDGKPVVEIGESAFAESNVTNIALPEYLKKIDKEAFYNCTELTYIYFNDNLEELEEGAFGKTGLTEVKLPESLSIIRDTVFAGTKLSSVYIPKNVTLVSYTAFIYSELENIEVDPDNIIYTAIDGVLYSRDVKELHIVPCKKTGSFVIPAEVFNVNVGAFSWCNDITDISLEDGSQLKKVDRLAFVQCESLTKIDLSKAGETIESGAIYGCDNLSEVYFSPNMSTVPEDVFYDGVIPATLTKVGLGSNCECSIEWPENVEVIIYGEDE